MAVEARSKDAIEANITNRYEQLKAILFDILGGPVDDFEITKRSPVPTYRAMIITVLRSEGYTLTAIGRAAGKTHAMIFDYVRRLNDIVDHPMSIDAPLLETWSRFQQAVLDNSTGYEKVNFYMLLGSIKDECKRVNFNFMEEVCDCLRELLRRLRRLPDKL